MDTYKFKDIKALEEQIRKAKDSVEQAINEVYAVRAYIDGLKDHIKYLEQENERLAVLLSRVA
jgi:septal ring factor EnvC (AmiA/AmiB activator)